MLQETGIAQTLGVSATIMKDENADKRTGLWSAKQFVEGTKAQCMEAIMRVRSEVTVFELHSESDDEVGQFDGDSM